MVRLDPSLIDGTRQQVWCINCGSNRVDRESSDSYRCGDCHEVRPRAVIIDPAVTWWIAGDGEYWRESTGIFLRNPVGAFLLFRRTRFPVGLTIPAGHVNAGESAEVAARRELSEETSVHAGAFHLLGDDRIVGDSCRRGSDAHYWHTYMVDAHREEEIAVSDEGRDPVWLSLPELRASAELTVATAFLIERYGERLAFV
ncbi:MULTISPECIES: NUDIX hydrolase [unclassified Micromonospora]|uniref:NUDIX hydrolase n=1 Tax=unclassified Micromonospora TaxID=2617518 RepID=UPI003A86AC45